MVTVYSVHQVYVFVVYVFVFKMTGCFLLLSVDQNVIVFNLTH